MKKYLLGIFIILIFYSSSIFAFIFGQEYYFYTKSFKNAKMDIASLVISEDDKEHFDYNSFSEDITSLYTDNHCQNAKLSLTNEHLVYVLNRCVEGFDLSDSKQEKLAKYLKESVDEIELAPPYDSEEFASFNLFSIKSGPSTYLGNGYVFVEVKDVTDGNEYFVFVGPNYKYVGTIGYSFLTFHRAARIAITIRCVSICFMVIAIIYTAVYWKKKR